MNFKCKFGINEIVENNILKNGELISSELYKVTYIIFDGERTVIGCRHPNSGITVNFKEDELNGDPDYSQEYGRYIET